MFSFIREGALRPFAVVALLGALCVSPRAVAAAQEAVAPVEREQPIYLKLPWAFQFRFAGYVAAVEKGFYRRRGLQVLLLNGLPGAGVVDDVVGGRAQFGVSSTALLAHRAYGQPVVMLAPVLQKSPHVLLALEAAGIDGPDDLKNRRLMLADGFGSAEIWAMLRTAGIIDEDVAVSEPSWRIADLVQHRVDAMDALVSDHPQQLKRLGLAYEILRPEDYGIDFYGDLLFTSERYLSRYPEKVAAFREASLEGWEYALAHPEEVIDLLLEKYQTAGNGYGREFLRQEARTLRGLILWPSTEIGRSDPARWEKITQTYVDLGFIPAQVDLRNFFYRSRGWSHWALQLGAATAVAGCLVLAGWWTRRKKWRRSAGLQNDLRQALPRGELVLHYQPQLDLNTEKVIGMEALLRWHHPRRGLLQPGEFLPLAEESGLMVPIGQWVLTVSCRQMKIWQEQAGYPLRLALNLSPRQFFSPTLISTIRKVTAETGFSPDQLELEIGEKVVRDDGERAVAIMKGLAALGVGLVIDDFGGSPSSLDCLKGLPISVVKVDPARVMSAYPYPPPASDVPALVAVARSLGIGVIAKGIETPAQLESLKRDGFRMGQGFLLGRPEKTPIQIDFAMGVV